MVAGWQPDRVCLRAIRHAGYLRPRNGHRLATPLDERRGGELRPGLVARRTVDRVRLGARRQPGNLRDGCQRWLGAAPDDAPVRRHVAHLVTGWYAAGVRLGPCEAGRAGYLYHGREPGNYTPDRRPHGRDPARVVAGWQLDRVRFAARWQREHLPARGNERSHRPPDGTPGRGYRSILVAGRQLDRLHVRSRRKPRNIPARPAGARAVPRHDG